MSTIRTFIILSSLLLLSSCAVMNNLYVNDPVSVEDDGANVYLGIGTGIRADVDSVDQNGNISFSDDLIMAPSLCIGGQINLVDKLDLRVVVHLPYIIGGFGLRTGPQFSFFKKESKFNLALGADFGFVLAKDSLKILGTTSELDIYANSAFNADFFIPFSYSFNNETRIIITPRYSFNTINIRHNTGESESFKFEPEFPSLTLGLRIKSLYFEISAFRFQGEYFPNFGVVYFIAADEE